MYERIVTFAVGILIGVIGTFAGVHGRQKPVDVPSQVSVQDSGADKREIIRQANETQARYLQQLNDLQSERDALKSQVSALQTAVKMKGEDDSFVASAYTLIYEPGEATTEETPAYELLDALKPGLGKTIAKLQSAAAGPSGVTAGGGGFGRLRWVLYRKPGGFPQGLLMPKGGHVVTTFTLPEIQQ